MSTYDQWKCDPGWGEPDEDGPSNEDEYLDEQSQFDAALARDEVCPGYHRYGPYVVNVLENGDVDFCATIILPASVGWEPTF